MEISNNEGSENFHSSHSVSTSAEGGACPKTTEWNAGIIFSDSEDNLPFCGFKSPNSVTSRSISEDHNDPQNNYNISSSRKIDGELLEVYDFETILEAGLKSNTSCESSNLTECNDDIKFMHDTAQEIKVRKSTVKSEPHYELMNPEVSLTIFNFQTIKLEHFIPHDISIHPELFSATFEQLLTHKSLLVVSCNENIADGLCTFCLYLMSVHPVSHVTDMCFEYLSNKSDFCPSFSDFINIFRNWGFELEKLYRSTPDMYAGFNDGITRDSPKQSKEIKEHNLQIVFRYLKYVVQIHFPDSFYNLIEPLIRIMFDVNIYSISSLHLKVYQILVLLTDSENDSNNKSCSGNILVKDIHLEDLSLQQQTHIYTKVLRYTRFGISLGYATLQQCLGCSEIIYSENVTLKNVHDLLIRNEKKIGELSYLTIFCFLQIIDMFLFHVQLVDDEVCEEKINYENWHDLLSNWSLLVRDSSDCLDPMYVKEKIGQIKYLLNMKRGTHGQRQKTFMS